MVNFGPLAAEIVLLVWGTPGNFNVSFAIRWRVWGTHADFNGFRVLAALLHGSQVVRQPHFAALNRRRHLRSAGRPSGWALTHILVCYSVLPLW